MLELSAPKRILNHRIHRFREYVVSCAELASSPKSCSLVPSSSKDAALASVIPIPWSAREQVLPPPPIIITAPSPVSQSHQKPIALALWMFPWHVACLKPPVVAYWPPYWTVQWPRHWLLVQTAPFLKLPKAVIFDRNVLPPTQFPIVCKRAVCWRSLLRVIFNSLPLTVQNAGAIMSALDDGSVVLP